MAMPFMMSPFDILGISQDANPQEIRAAYLKRALEVHPDKPGGDKEAFQHLVHAFEVLSDTVHKAYHRGIFCGPCTTTGAKNKGVKRNGGTAGPKVTPTTPAPAAAPAPAPAPAKGAASATSAGSWDRRGSAHATSSRWSGLRLLSRSQLWSWSSLQSPA